MIPASQAARLAGLDRLAFQRYLGARGIKAHYRIEELDEDIRAIDELSGT